MPSLELFVAAESASVDQLTNRLSVFNVIEQLNVSEFPTKSPPLTVIALLNAEEGDAGQDFQALIEIKSPGDKSKELRGNFQFTNKRARLIVHFDGISIKETGEMLIDLSVNNRHFASHRVFIVKEDSPSSRP